MPPKNRYNSSVSAVSTATLSNPSFCAVSSADELYRRYAGVIYFIICKEVKDQEEVDLLFIDVFSRICSNKVMTSPGAMPTTLNIIKLTNSCVHDEFGALESTTGAKFICPDFPIMNLLVQQSCSLSQVGACLMISIEEVKAGFVKELSRHRSQHVRPLAFERR